DDLPGRVFGGSVQYDVAGNIDDALDHNALLGISEGITITLEFNAPSTPGIKMGSDAIGLEVSDEQTEGDVSSGRYSVDPFPYPYLVIGTDYEFLLFELTGGNAGLDIEYGGSRLFGSGSRASDLSMSAHGFKYVSTDGSTVAVIEVPSDPSVIVNPLIMSISDGGEYALDMYHYRTLTVDPATPSTSWVSVVSSQEGYTGILPGTAGSLLELDMDGDGLFTDNDDDIDGDGIPNDEDTDPYNSDVRNHHPSVTVEASSLEIANNKDLVLEATGADVDGDALSYSWSVSPSTGWTAQVASVTVDLDDYVRGSYTFTVAVSDGKGGSDQASVTVDVTEGEDQNGTPIWLVVLIIVVVLVIVGAVVFYVLRGEKGSDEEPLEMEQPREEDGEEQVEISAASGGYYEQAETIESSAPIKEETMQGYEESLDPDEPYVSQPVPEPLPVESEMQEVQDLEFLIDEMERTEEEIGDICPECGATLGPTDPNCPNCGAEFDIALECPSCGAVIEDGAEVCPSCGVTFQ
ncbi:MAG: hypothetical protein JXA22_01650, partial [Candidatus Thermoplasmatota archaeon]|nr:hypothetical protein [Candidatus Thermoplasmatota archaeon]